jgi:hypothetical protein
MFYEYRRYDVQSGRMPDLLKRFEHDAVPAWERHGIRVVGMWQAVVGETSQLHYLVQWDSLAQRESLWSAFQKDPDWLAAKRESEAVGGPLVRNAHNEIWRSVSFPLGGAASSR